MRGILLLFIGLSSAPIAQAKTSLNSMCYMLDEGNNTQIHGERAQELFEIASVSKVVTSYWAIRKLGPHFRFTTRIFVTPVSRDIFDVHIQGSQDPFWGRQLTHFLFSELNRMRVREIRNLTFDENLSFRWSVISDYIEPSNPSPQEIAGYLEQHIRNLSVEYPRTRQEAAALGLRIPRTLTLKVHSVGHLPNSEFRSYSDTRTYLLKSAPLSRYLKEMNIISNNHVADGLFTYLGGPVKFRNFMERDMNMDATDLQFVNGSGNSVVVGDNGNGTPIKEYNKASCDTIVRVLFRMHRVLRQTYKLDLKDVMAVSGADGGTLSPRFDSLPNSIVAKTGTVDPAVTLAGTIATAQGTVYFGIFMNTESPADWSNARDKVRSKVVDLIRLHKGRKKFPYASRGFLPFDRSSFLTSEAAGAQSLP